MTGRATPLVGSVGEYTDVFLLDLESVLMELVYMISTNALLTELKSMS